MSKLAVYTVLTGGKEPLGDPTSDLESSNTDLEIDFICFSDNTTLRSNVWQCRRLDTHSLPPEKSSRRPKILPHEYLSDYKYSLYMDNICKLKRLPRVSDLRSNNASNYCYKLFRHNTRNLIAEEALAIARIGYDDAHTLISQLDSYGKILPLETISPLSTCTVLLREHNHYQVVKHGINWWEHVLNFSKRDQMSFDFCRITTGLEVTYLTGNKFENDLIHPHANASNSRVLANADRSRFDWLQKFYIAAGLDANLANERAALEGKRPREDFELLLYLHGSSFGRHHMPRRNASDKLREILSTLTNDSKAVTALWRDNFRTSYWHTNEHEFLRLLNAINSYFGTNTISALKYQTDLDRRALLTAIGESEKSVLLIFNANHSDKAFITQFFDESKANSRTMKVILFSHDQQSPWCIGF